MNILLIKVYDFCIEDICKAVRFYSHETIHCECTNEEILSLAKKHDVHVFTIDPNIDIPSWTTSDIDAPAKYNTSKIDLNLSLKSIANSISLRTLGLMDSVGFLSDF